ncbi:MAG: metal ABC transporter substrate-binding protein [Lentisphaerae bacterium GWF2_50_93]|nr:MAG: metal ABC transporter substrate-binding protein [Lentisphaerae bacterium GWF2_50_93]
MSGVRCQNVPGLKIFFLSLSLIFSGSVSGQDQKTRIVTSFYPMYIAVLNITENIDGISATNMTRQVSGCLHDYQLTPDDLKTLSGTDIFVVNGAGMESFLEKVIKSKPDLKIVYASEGIDLIKTGNEANPHVWVSVSLHIRQVKNIAEGLSKYDPKHAGGYRRNADAYVGKLEQMREKISASLKDMKKSGIITFHEAFPYFAKEFGLNIAAVVEREPGSDPDAREMARTIDLIRETNVKVIFIEPQYSAKSAETIARETGARLYVLDPVVTGPLSADAYLKIMEKNLETLKEALK